MNTDDLRAALQKARAEVREEGTELLDLLDTMLANWGDSIPGDGAAPYTDLTDKALLHSLMGIRERVSAILARNETSDTPGDSAG